MSLKPPKKSDLKKAWMTPRMDRRRKIQPEYHLIVTEGTKTEPFYFGAIKKIVNDRYGARVQLDIFGEGDNTINLFNRAKRRAAESDNGYRHVWIVYDTDDFPAESVDEVVSLCRENSNDETEYHAIWSNQCIELWYLLHFCFMNADLHRSEYYPKLTRYMGEIGAGRYEKIKEDMYEILKPFMDAAIANAKKLAKLHEGKMPSQAAPSTKVYELMEKLKPYL